MLLQTRRQFRGLAWRGAVTDASLAMPLVPGARPVFGGLGVVVTVSGSVLTTGGLDFRSTGLATITGAGTIVLGGTGSAGREVAVADGSHALIATRITGSSGLFKTGLGRLTITGSNGFTGTTVVGGGTFAIGNGGATGSVDGDLRVDAGGVVAFNRNNRLVIATPITGAGGVTQLGSGATVMTAANTHTGPTSVQAGTLRLEHAAALAASPTTVAGGRLEVADGLSVSLPELDIAAGFVDVGRGGLSIAAGGMAPSDLLAALLDGRGDGSWNGTRGIRSLAVSTDAALGTLRTLGWAEQPNGSLLVGYAVAGDATMDGVVDILDLSTLISSSAYNTGAAATWGEGDFNYDGVYDMLDVADLFSAGFFDQGDYRAARASAVPVAAVPEPALPATLGVGLLAGMALLGRRGIRRRAPLDGRCPWGDSLPVEGVERRTDGAVRDLP